MNHPTPPSPSCRSVGAGGDRAWHRRRRPGRLWSGRLRAAGSFFRFPGFASTPELLAYLQQRGISVFGADLWASDWNKMTPEQELALVLQRLDAAGGGIILFHDTKTQTAAMIPTFLRTLAAKGYRVVHIIPARQPPSAR